MLISIAIVTRNRCTELLRLLKNICKQNFNEYEIIVVDNNSDDNTKATVNQFFTKQNVPCKYIRLADNAGSTGGRDKAFTVSSGKYVFFIDDDAYIEDNTFLNSVYNFMEANQEVGIMQTAIYNITEEEYQLPIYSKKRFKDYYPAFNFIGASHVIRKNIFTKKENLYLDRLFYRNEETYLALKVSDRNFKVVYYPEIEIIHQPSQVRIAEKEIYYNNFINGFVIKQIFYPLEFKPFLYIIYFLRFIKNYGINRKLLKKMLSDYRYKTEQEECQILKRSTICRLIGDHGLIKFINW